MRITLRLIISLLLTTAVVVLSFSYVQTQIEDSRLTEDLGLRARLIAKSFKEAVEPFIEQTEQPARIRRFIEKFQGHSRLIGVTVGLKGEESISFPENGHDWEIFQSKLAEVIETAAPVEWLGRWNEKPVHFYAVPIEKDNVLAGALGVVHDRSYIVRRISDTWKRLAVTFSILALILSATTLVIIRWSITGPIARIAEMVRKATGREDLPGPQGLKDKGEMEKLFLAVGQMASHLKAARLDLAQQARLANSSGIIWTKGRLKDYLKTKLNGKQLYVIANREPYIHQKLNGSIECITPASGVVTGLDPVLKAAGGMWIAHGAGNADRETVDSQDKLRVPPPKPAYTLKRVWLNAEEEKGYYYGFSNEGLWPLCHISHVRPIFRIEDWQMYKAVNQ
ncbi:MAG: trehalose-6-phosphate synthase, partial [Candidatus Omnitrophica bacterium]|nr:trehalose-6-phosphate synthase [Candidatus Omnitrophota bacterium]